VKHPDSGRADLMVGLNEDLAHEYASVIRYRTFASGVRGVARLTLRPLFAREIGDELSHAELLADAIVALGATPTTDAAPVAAADSPAEMLRHALEAERAALARYVERRLQADALGEYGLVVALDSVIADETRHRDELRLVLIGWTETPAADAVAAEAVGDAIAAGAVGDMPRQTERPAGVGPADVRSADVPGSGWARPHGRAAAAASGA
jgi:bacterioferritin